MKATNSWWNIGLVVVSLALPVTAIGCGDDDDGGGASGSGGNTSGSGASGGAGGRGGAGGSPRAGSGGASGSNAVTAAECTTETNALITSTQGALSSECVACICEQNTRVVYACTKTDANCWPLLACIGETCPDNPNECASANGECAPFLSGGVTAQGVGAALNSTACAPLCGSTGADAGVADDAGTN